MFCILCVFSLSCLHFFSSVIIFRNNILAKEIFDISEYLKVFSLDQRMRASLWLPLISRPLILFMFVLKSVFKLAFNICVIFNIFFLPSYPVPPLVAYTLLSHLLSCLLTSCHLLFSHHLYSVLLYVLSCLVFPSPLSFPLLISCALSRASSYLTLPCLIFPYLLPQAKQEEINAVSNAAAKSVRVLLYRTLGGEGEELKGEFTESNGTEYYKISVQVKFIWIDIP